MLNEKVVEKKNKKYQFVPMAFDPKECFFKQDKIVNSWFFIGRATVEGHDLEFLFHLMSGSVKNAGFMNTVVSVLDKTTGFYQSKDTVDKTIKIAEKKNGEMHIKTGFAEMNGNLESKINLNANLENCSFSIQVNPVGNVIYNGGAGFFPLLALKNNYQYSCPQMKMDGVITINGKDYTVKSGDCWFDRQWNSPDIKDAMNLKNLSLKWLWMGITLSNGTAISLWEIIASDNEIYSFATVLHKEGHQSVCKMSPVVENASEKWHSEVTNQNYPTHWKIEIPDFDINLNVVCNPAQQEIVSQAATLNKYEAASIVTGKFGEESVTGHATVELLGVWE